MRYVISFFWLVVIALVVVFAGLNAHTVSLNYYTGQHMLPLALVMLLSLFLGVVIGLLALLSLWLRCRKYNRKLRRQIKNLEQELKNLRQIPLKD